MSIGIKIVLKSGLAEHIDPVIREFTQDGVLYIDNGFHVYEYPQSKIARTEYYKVENEASDSKAG